MDQPYQVSKNDLIHIQIAQPQAYQQNIDRQKLEQWDVNYPQNQYPTAQKLDDPENPLPQNNFRNQIQITAESKAKVKDCIICLLYVLGPVAVTMGILLGTILPITLSSQEQKRVATLFKYQLPNGYSFTGNTNCSINLTISLSWTSSADLDLGIMEPGSQDLIRSINKTGKYGKYQGDSGRGPAIESYIAPCAITGEFLIKVRYLNKWNTNVESHYINVAVNSLQNFRKDLPQPQQNGIDYIIVAKLAISENPNTHAWNFQLV